MGEDIEIVGTMTAQEMLENTLARLDKKLPQRPPLLRPDRGEFTRSDWSEYKLRQGIKSAPSTIARDLDRMVENGTLEKARRWKPESAGGRPCWGYWFKDETG